MSEPPDLPVHERLAALEAQVADLRRKVEHLGRQAPPRQPAPPYAPAPRPRQAPLPPLPARPAESAPPPRAPRMPSALKSEDWLNKIGIGLLLIGLAFLFKFGIDKGWLTPQVRIGFGVVLGVFLLAAGLRLRPKRLRLGQVLLGGSIATFFVTLFAAYQFYNLVSYPAAFAGMGAATFLAFVLAVRQQDAVLAVIATLGGLGTPFLLYTEAGSLPGLVAYTCVILTCACSIYLYRGWRTLLLTTVVGGWLVFLVGWIQLTFDGPGTLADRAAFQAGVGFCWLAFGGVPVLRELWRHRDPARWAPPLLKAFNGFLPAEQPAVGLAVAAPLATLGLSVELWDLASVVWGIIILAAAVLYGIAYAVGLRRRAMTMLAQAHGLAAAVLLAISWFALFDDPSLQLLALAMQGAALHGLARALDDRVLRAAGHSLFAVIALWVAARVVLHDGLSPALANTRALADLAVLALVFGTAWTLRGPALQRIYRLAAYAGLLGWFWRDLVVLPNGQAYVSIAWGLCAIVLVALGWRRDADLIRNAGLVTLLIVVGKLFVIDLAKLEAVWRILLFLGFGGLLLLLSYFFPSLWKPDAEPDAPADDPAAGAERPAS